VEYVLAAEHAGTRSGIRRRRQAVRQCSSSRIPVCRMGYPMPTLAAGLRTATSCCSRQRSRLAAQSRRLPAQSAGGYRGQQAAHPQRITTGRPQVTATIFLEEGNALDSVAIRVFSFSILPVIIAAGHLVLDRSSRPRERRLEIFLLYLFGVGIAGSGIGGFFGHFFLSDSVAKSIGWPTGNPFQLEVGFANLAVGILSIGFREATVLAVTVFSVGATVCPCHGCHRVRQYSCRKYHPERQQLLRPPC
jgi:hypothetical protein